VDTKSLQEAGKRVNFLNLYVHTSDVWIHFASEVVNGRITFWRLKKEKYIKS